MKCSKCGLENIHGAMYCEDCGSLLKKEETTIQSRQEQYNPPEAYPQRKFAPPTIPVRPMSQRCPKCQKENVLTAIYCGGCGISLTGKGGVPNSPKCYAKLVPLGGGEEYFLDREKMLIGRRSDDEGLFPEIDLGDTDPSVGISRRHAQIIWKGSPPVLLEDLGSSNGTFINNSQIPEGVQTTLKDGDTLRFGGYSLVIRILAAG